MTPTAAAAGDLDGQPATAYAYRDPTGRRLIVYLSDRAFPVPTDAGQPVGPAGPWTVTRGDVTIVCASAPHELLIVGNDHQLVEAAAHALDAT